MLVEKLELPTNDTAIGASKFFMRDAVVFGLETRRKVALKDVSAKVRSRDGTWFDCSACQPHLHLHGP